MLVTFQMFGGQYDANLFASLYPLGLDVPDDLEGRRETLRGLPRGLVLELTQIVGGDFVYTLCNGATAYLRDGKMHRDGDLPAYENGAGRKEWWQHGERHRDDGPALIFADGTQFWCRHGKLHRDDGPALIYATGRTEWWTNGERVRVTLPS